MPESGLARDRRGLRAVRNGISGDSDAHIVKGLIALLFMMYSGKTAEEILSTDLEGLFERLDLEQHLSVNRRNGFYSMTLKIREHAAQAVATA